MSACLTGIEILGVFNCRSDAQFLYTHMLSVHSTTCQFVDSRPLMLHATIVLCDAKFKMRSIATISG